ncbi:MAG TPA: hypothetical protein VGO93_04320 [Candidatus Xenobia bacterium]|jgi:hypothetical protein
MSNALMLQNYGHGAALYRNEGPNGYLVKVNDQGRWQPVDHVDHDLGYDTLCHSYGIWSPGKTLGLISRNKEVSPKDVRPFDNMVVWNTRYDGTEFGGTTRYDTKYTLTDASLQVKPDEDGTLLANLAMNFDQQNFQRYVSGC